MLSCTVHEVDEIAVITLEDQQGAGEDRIFAQRESLYAVIRVREDPRFVLDLSGLNFLSSSDIGFLLGLKRRVEARKGRMVITQADPYIIDTLTTMKLHSMFVFAEDFRAAATQLS